MSLRPPLLLPASWAHASWLSPPIAPREPRSLREASLRLLAEQPALADPRARSLRLPRGRPAFARLCRLAAACSVPGTLCRCIGLRERQRLAVHIGHAALDRLQRDRQRSASLCVPLDPGDRSALTAHGLALYRRAYFDRPGEPWLPLRLPRTLAALDPATVCADPAFARRCVARALRLRRSGC